ncbi:uncharacterized protein [Montipora foliosa]|uniref:uncharacterized protein n=1 Tax=Montipora foliosa TaxID=591990 RepID=UPI0035F18E1A
MGRELSEEENVDLKERTLQAQSTQSVPLVNSQGKMLLPPAGVEECSRPMYANPRQILRILKRREVKRRLGSLGKLRKRTLVKAASKNDAKNPDLAPKVDSETNSSPKTKSDEC